MEIVNIEARTFEAMLSAFRTFADRLDTLCRLYGDMEEKKWLDNQEVCDVLRINKKTLQAYRAKGLLPFSRIKPRRPGDIATCYCDPGKAERELGWKAQYGIKEMCADSWRWQKNNPNGYED